MQHRPIRHDPNRDVLAAAAPRLLCDQAPVVAFLASPSAHGGATPRHIETHLSHLFLAGDRVLKLKKAVRWAMVDYARLAQREACCRRELSVNAAAAPDLYLAVLPVTRTAAGFALDGAGEVVDWVVAMRRFPADAQLDAMVDAGTITPAIVDAAADAVAALHKDAPVVPVEDGAARIAAVTDQLHRDVERHAGALGRDAVDAWATVMSARLAARRHDADARGREGFVGRCHGDLHLANICLWRGRPTPFDAIEFSEEVATVDVMYDLAFVLADLDRHGRPDLSTRLLSRYLEATRDYAGLGLLPIFTAQRAMVMALTNAAKGCDPGPPVALALRIACRQQLPRLVAIGGFSGSGKSTAAFAHAPGLDAVVIRSDSVRKRLMGRAPEERLGLCGYARAVTDATYGRLLEDARAAVLAGSSVILDATFAERGARDRVRALAADLAVPFTGLWLDAPAALLRQRVAGRRGDASDADAGVVTAQLAGGAGELDWAVVDASGSPDATAAQIDTFLS